ncbi:MAG: acyltransferase [Chthoniobacterales bacterium]|nr:acyltransferase [Chthoniobacterales bacterium]
MDVLLEKTEPLTDEEKKLFGRFGAGSKIRPPFRILNPHRIFIGDNVSIREECYLHAYENLTKLHDFIEERYKGDFDPSQYKYDSRIEIGREVQIGRNFFISCTNLVEIGRNVTISERVFIGDNNHSFSHPDVPIMQQPNKVGIPVLVGQGSWIGAGASLLGGTRLGKNSVVGTLSVVKGEFPDYAVVGPEPAKLLFVKEHRPE